MTETDRGSASPPSIVIIGAGPVGSRPSWPPSNRREIVVVVDADDIAGDVWSMSDAEIVSFGIHELSRRGLVPAHAVQAGYVVRMPVEHAGYGQQGAPVEALGVWLELDAEAL